MVWAIAAVAFYFFFVAPRTTKLTSTSYTPRATGAPAIGLTGGVTTEISLPGVGSYTNVGGGQQIGVSLDGNLVTSLQNLLSGS